MSGMAEAFKVAAASLYGDSNMATDGVFQPRGGSDEDLLVSEGNGVILSSTDETEQNFTVGSRREGSEVASVHQDAVSRRPADGDGLIVAGVEYLIRAADPTPGDVEWKLDIERKN